MLKEAMLALRVTETEYAPEITRLLESAETDLKMAGVVISGTCVFVISEDAQTGEITVTDNSTITDKAEYDVTFVNLSLEGDGGYQTYYNEFPPLIEGENAIHIEIYLYEPNYIPRYSSNYFITYTAQNNDQGGNNGEGNQGGEGGAVTPGGGATGGPTSGGESCGSSSSSLFTTGTTLFLAYVTLMIVRVNPKKKKC